jgi:hypothetical protein
MKQETLHLCAAALSMYTEVLGGMITGNLKRKGAERANYEAFLAYLGEPYAKLNEELVRHRTNLYTEVRSKLIHQFGPDKTYGIHLSKELQDKPGIEYVFGDSLPINFKREPNTQYYPFPDTINILVREYYRDFQKGVDKYYHKLEVEGKSLIGRARSDTEIPLYTNFMNAISQKVG